MSERLEGNMTENTVDAKIHINAPASQETNDKKPISSYFKKMFEAVKNLNLFSSGSILADKEETRKTQHDDLTIRYGDSHQQRVTRSRPKRETKDSVYTVSCGLKTPISSEALFDEMRESLEKEKRNK